jgi:superfamily II DNA or RNA helicase
MNCKPNWQTVTLHKHHQRIIVFAATVEHANLLAAVLRARKIDARSITAKTPSDQRQAASANFKAESDAPRVLCNYGVLTAGFDAPRTSAAVIARPTKSLVLYSQMIGRAIRGKRAGGNETAEIITVVDYNHRVLAALLRHSAIGKTWGDCFTTSCQHTSSQRNATAATRRRLCHCRTDG